MNPSTLANRLRGELASIVTRTNYLDFGPKVFFVTGQKTLSTLGGRGFLSDILPDTDLTFWLYSGPVVSDIEADNLIEELNKSGPNLVIGLGGGVAMDFAKIGAALGRECVEKVSSRNPEEWSRPVPFALPLLLIPTLFGSGAESTFHAVFYSRAQKYSMAFEDNGMMRRLLVPELSDSAGIHNRLYAALDAVCQGIETTWARSSTFESREISNAGLSSVLLGFQDYVFGIASPKREGFVHGSSRIGEAMNQGKTTAPHALSYFLTSKLGLPHGYAVAVILRSFWLYMNAEQFRTRFTGGLEQRLLEIRRAMDTGFTGSFDFVEWLDDVLRKHELERDIKKILQNHEIKAIDFIRSSNRERLKNHPFELNDCLLSEIMGLEI